MRKRSMLAGVVLTLPIISCSNTTGLATPREVEPVPPAYEAIAYPGGIPISESYPVGTANETAVAWYPTLTEYYRLTEIAPTATVFPTLGRAEQTAEIEEYKSRAAITLADRGKELTVQVGHRFSVFLDDVEYPVDELSCTPEGYFGYISNASFRGLHLYPITFEAVLPGRCSLSNRDFRAEIIVVELASATPSTP